MLATVLDVEELLTIRQLARIEWPDSLVADARQRLPECTAAKENVEAPASWTSRRTAGEKRRINPP